MNKRILIVDDDRDMVATLADILEMHGWTTVKGYDGAEAIVLAAREEVDVVLMDVRMPRVNGLEALRAIKENRPATRVVLMTAFAAQELLVRAQEEGALKILRKPVDLTELLATLEASAENERSVLVVDDDAEYLGALTGMLESHGVNTVAADSLTAALERMHEAPPAAILLDLELEHIDPQKSFLAIRHLSPSVLLILYSSRAADLNRTVRETPPGLIDAAFIKPVPIEKLLAILEPH